MNVTDYTPAQYLAAISAALRAEDMEAAATLVRCLAIVDPASARDIYEAVMYLNRRDDSGGIDGAIDAYLDAARIARGGAS